MNLLLTVVTVHSVSDVVLRYIDILSQADTRFRYLNYIDSVHIYALFGLLTPFDFFSAAGADSFV